MFCISITVRGNINFDMMGHGGDGAEGPFSSIALSCIKQGFFVLALLLYICIKKSTGLARSLLPQSTVKTLYFLKRLQTNSAVITTATVG
jgi:hypothetical protein